VQHTEKILQAMRVNLHLCNLAWDIKQAYTWAPLPPGERIAVVYPDGFKRVDANGDELFLVLERNLYGLPSAGRGWGKHRDAFILKRFNEPGWSCCKLWPLGNGPNIFNLRSSPAVLTATTPGIDSASEVWVSALDQRSAVLLRRFGP
jgi:hypothetical protein